MDALRLSETFVTLLGDAALNPRRLGPHVFFYCQMHFLCAADRMSVNKRTYKQTGHWSERIMQVATNEICVIEAQCLLFHTFVT